MIKNLYLSLLLVLFWLQILSQPLTVDLRSENDSDPTVHYITFAARTNTATGHEFVIFETDNYSTNVYTGTAFGFYPAAEETGFNPEAAFGFVPGQIKNDLASVAYLENSKAVRFIVDQVDYVNALIFVQKAQAAPDSYNLFMDNCIEFIQDIGNQIGLDMPSRFFYPTPAKYMNHLVNLLLNKNGIKYKNGQKIKDVPGYTYFGKIKHKEPNGDGRANFTNGDRYSGHFKNGWMDGNGQKQFSIKTTRYNYNGGFSKGLFQGQGTVAGPDGTSISGKFAGHLLPDGPVTMTFPDKSTIKTTLVNGNPSGISTLTTHNGAVVEGTIDTHLAFNGQGKVTWPNGTVYVGNLKNNNPDGSGTFTYGNGDKYAGSNTNGVKNGKGTYTWKSGNAFDGNFLNGQPSGQGTYTYANGSSTSGGFNGGTFTGGTVTTSDGIHHSPTGDTTDGNSEGKIEWFDKNGNYHSEKIDPIQIDSPEPDDTGVDDGTDADDGGGGGGYRRNIRSLQSLN